MPEEQPHVHYEKQHGDVRVQIELEGDSSADLFLRLMDEVLAWEASKSDVETTRITPAEFAEQMNEIFHEREESWDTEKHHIMRASKLMERVLRSMGYEEGLKIFSSAKKWYS